MAGVWKFLTNKWVLIGMGVLILFAFAYTYAKAKLGGSHVNYPNNGSGIPSGWSPNATVTVLHNAMSGLGTDPTAIWNALDGLTPDQLAAVYNEFNRQYENVSGGWSWITGTPTGDLMAWFDSELSGPDLSRALNYFNGVV